MTAYDQTRERMRDAAEMERHSILKTSHSPDCRRVFARLDPICPRCRELAAGAAPRAGWNNAAKRFNEQFRRDLAAHDCKKSGCGPVCTAFDW